MNGVEWNLIDKQLRYIRNKQDMRGRDDTKHETRTTQGRTHETVLRKERTRTRRRSRRGEGNKKGKADN